MLPLTLCSSHPYSPGVSPSRHQGLSLSTLLSGRLCPSPCLNSLLLLEHILGQFSEKGCTGEKFLSFCVCFCCRNRLPKTRQIKTTSTYYLTVVEARSLKSRRRKGCFLPGGSGVSPSGLIPVVGRIQFDEGRGWRDVFPRWLWAGSLSQPLQGEKKNPPLPSEKQESSE